MAIEVSGLVKTYGETRALNGVDLTVAEGEVFALLGPNGAGKSTTVEILEGHRTASAGSVRVLGVDPETGGRAYRERIGIVLQETAIESALTVRESIDIYGALYPPAPSGGRVDRDRRPRGEGRRPYQDPIGRSAAPPRTGTRHGRRPGTAVSR